MATQKQIKANRQNARKSTGPKSDEGKAAVSQNAVKHGLFAESVIKGENEAEFEAFHDQMLAELSPVGMIESMLAERIVSLWWRLRRAERMQNEAIEDMIGRKVTNDPARHERECYYTRQGIMMGDPRMDLDDLPLGRIAVSDWSNCRVLDRMLMYERRIENSVIKNIKELKRFQVMRRIEFEDAEQKQTTHSKAIPKRGTDLKPVENMAKMAMPLDKAPSLRDEAATRSISSSLRDEAATAMLAEKHDDLKKQSQFMPGEVDAKSFVKEDYDKTPAAGDEENKANRTCPEPVEWSQFPALERIIGVEKGEKLPKITAG